VSHSPAAGLSASASVLRNRVLRAEIARTARPRACWTSRPGREALAGRANQLWVYPPTKPRNWDAWDLEDDYEKKGIELVEPAAIELSKPVRTAPRSASSRLS